MTPEQSGPVTFGQLWVMRSLQRVGPDGWADANMVEVFPVHPSATAAQVVDAWFELVRIHESLRTVYQINRAVPTQIVRAVRRHDLKVVELPEATEEAAASAATDWASEPILIEEELPWRAFLGVCQGRLRFLVVVIHHIAVDDAALRILRADLGRVLRTGASSCAATQPRGLAEEQRGDRARRESTMAYWTNAWHQFNEDDRGRVDEGDRFGAALCSTPALRAGERIADELGISFQAVLLGVACLILMRYKNRDSVTLGLMVSNRFTQRWTTLVSSMVQLAPVTVISAQESSVGDFLRGVYLSGSEAYSHGSYDVDELRNELTELGHANPEPMSFDCLFNFVGSMNYSVHDENPEVTSVRFKKARRQIGYRFFLFLFTSKSRGLSVHLGASESYLAPELVRQFVAALEAALIRVAEDRSVPVTDLDLTPMRPVGRAVHGA